MIKMVTVMGLALIILMGAASGQEDIYVGVTPRGGDSTPPSKIEEKAIRKLESAQNLLGDSLPQLESQHQSLSEQLKSAKEQKEVLQNALPRLDAEYIKAQATHGGDQEYMKEAQKLFEDERASIQRKLQRLDTRIPQLERELQRLTLRKSIHELQSKGVGKDTKDWETERDELMLKRWQEVTPILRDLPFKAEAP